MGTVSRGCGQDVNRVCTECAGGLGVRALSTGLDGGRLQEQGVNRV